MDPQLRRTTMASLNDDIFSTTSKPIPTTLSNFMNSIIADTLTIRPPEPVINNTTPFEHERFDQEMASTLSTYTRRFANTDFEIKETVTNTPFQNFKPIETDVTEATPFEITESLKLALSTSPAIIEENRNHLLPIINMEQEEYPKNELDDNKLYSWERKRGENFVDPYPKQHGERNL